MIKTDETLDLFVTGFASKSKDYYNGSKNQNFRICLKGIVVEHEQIFFLIAFNENEKIKLSDEIEFENKIHKTNDILLFSSDFLNICVFKYEKKRANDTVKIFTFAKNSTKTLAGLKTTSIVLTSHSSSILLFDLLLKDTITVEPYDLIVDKFNEQKILGVVLERRHVLPAYYIQKLLDEKTVEELVLNQMNIQFGNDFYTTTIFDGPESVGVIDQTTGNILLEVDGLTIFHDETLFDPLLNTYLSLSVYLNYYFSMNETVVLKLFSIESNSIEYKEIKLKIKNKIQQEDDYLILGGLVFKKDPLSNKLYVDEIIETGSIPTEQYFNEIGATLEHYTELDELREEIFAILQKDLPYIVLSFQSGTKIVVNAKVIYDDIEIYSDSFQLNQQLKSKPTVEEVEFELNDIESSLLKQLGI